jgi:hypothetical protein
VEAVEARLAQEGCRAADYRLVGDPLHHLCVAHLRGLSGQWRLLIGFPAASEVAILDVDRHDRRHARNIYQKWYDLLSMDEPTEERTKPPCCKDGEPPVNQALVERILDLLDSLR